MKLIAKPTYNSNEYWDVDFVVIVPETVRIQERRVMVARTLREFRSAEHQVNAITFYDELASLSAWSGGKLPKKLAKQFDKLDEGDSLIVPDDFDPEACGCEAQRTDGHMVEMDEGGDVVWKLSNKYTGDQLEVKIEPKPVNGDVELWPELARSGLQTSPKKIFTVVLLIPDYVAEQFGDTWCGWEIEAYELTEAVALARLQCAEAECARTGCTMDDLDLNDFQVCSIFAGSHRDLFHEWTAADARRQLNDQHYAENREGS